MAEETKEKKDYKSLVYRDALTNLYNRRYFSQVVPKLIKRAEKKEATFCMAVVDLDHFKEVNDTFGHAKGDELLKSFAKVYKKVMPDNAYLFRYAGDEFTLVLPQRSKQQSKKILDSLLEKSAEKVPSIVGLKGDLNFSLSAGISNYPKDADNHDDLFEYGDQALYKAKENGRGQVCLYPDSGKIMNPEDYGALFSDLDMIGRDKLLERVVKDIFPGDNERKFVLLKGERGVGKSAFLEKLAGEILQRDWKTMTLEGHTYSRDNPYSAIVDGLDSFLKDNPGVFKSVVKGLHLNQKKILIERIPQFDKIPDKYFDEDKAEVTEFPTLLKEILENILSEYKLACLVDDIYWVDKFSFKLLDSLFSDHDDNFLLCATTLDEFGDMESDFERKLRNFEYIMNNSLLKERDIKKFDIEKTEEFLRVPFPDIQFPDDLVESIFNVSQGVPYVIIDVLVFLIEEGKVKYSDDEWQLEEDYEGQLELTDMIEIRLGVLSEQAREVLEKAAVLGKEFDVRILSELLPQQEGEILELLEKAVHKYIIQELDGEKGLFAFQDEEYRKRLYNEISSNKREEMHHKIAEVEEEYFEDNIGAVISDVAYHYRKAGDWQNSIGAVDQMDEIYSNTLLPEAGKKKLDDRLFDKTSIKEKPINEDELPRAAEVIRAFKIALQNRRLYPKENKNVIKSINKLDEEISYFLDKYNAFSLNFVENSVLINGDDPPQEVIEKLPIEEVHDIFEKFGLSGILFAKGLEEEEITKFLEVFLESAEEVRGKWKQLLKERNIKHVLPDQKFYVAVGDKEMAVQSKKDGGKIDVKAEEDEEERQKPQVDDDRVEEIKRLFKEFEEKLETLKDSLDEEDVSERKLDELNENLKSIGEVGEEIGVSGEQDSQGQKRKVKSDAQNVDTSFVEELEEDFQVAIDRLKSDEKSARVNAVKTLIGMGEPILDNLLEQICSTDELYQRKLMAAVVKKMGDSEVEEFLDKIKPSFESPSRLRKITDILPLFNNDKAFKTLKEVVYSSPARRKILNLVKDSSSPKAEELLLELLRNSQGKLRENVIEVIGKKGIKEATAYLVPLIEKKMVWQDEPKDSLQKKAALALGKIGSQVTLAPLKRAIKRKPFFFWERDKSKEVKKAIAWALGNFEDEETIEILEDLKDHTQDKSLQNTIDESIEKLRSYGK